MEIAARLDAAMFNATVTPQLGDALTVADAYRVQEASMVRRYARGGWSSGSDDRHWISRTGASKV